MDSRVEVYIQYASGSTTVRYTISSATNYTETKTYTSIREAVPRIPIIRVCPVTTMANGGFVFVKIPLFAYRTTSTGGGTVPAGNPRSPTYPVDKLLVKSRTLLFGL